MSTLAPREFSHASYRRVVDDVATERILTHGDMGYKNYLAGNKLRVALGDIATYGWTARISTENGITTNDGMPLVDVRVVVDYPGGVTDVRTFSVPHPEGEELPVGLYFGSDSSPLATEAQQLYDEGNVQLNVAGGVIQTVEPFFAAAGQTALR